MAASQLDRFRRYVIDHPATQAALWKHSDRFAFASFATEHAHERGITVELDAFRTALQASRFDIPIIHDARGEDLDLWTPLRVYQHDKTWMVDWAYIGGKHWHAPFYDHTIQEALRHPFNRLMRRQTTLELLQRRAEMIPTLAPRGFIFHMSRCGSTLVAQMFTALPHALVISEAEPLDNVVRAHLSDPTMSDEQQIAWLRAMVATLGRARRRTEHDYYVKFDSWNILHLPLIRRAFPDVPWVFIGREPVEVMVSHQRLRGSQMIPGVLEPELLGIPAAEIAPHALDEYCARVLGRISAAAADYMRFGGTYIDYTQLPDAVWSEIADIFGMTLSDDDRTIMQTTAQFHAKQPMFMFAKDTDAKQHAASSEVRMLADRWVRPLYEQLRGH